MSEQDIEIRKEELEMIARKIQESNIQMPDIRERNWRNIECDASRLLSLLIEAENLLLQFDEYQMENDQCYPEFEDLMLQVGEIRAKYTDFVDKNLQVLEIKTK